MGSAQMLAVLALARAALDSGAPAGSIVALTAASLGEDEETVSRVLILGMDTASMT